MELSGLDISLLVVAAVLLLTLFIVNVAKSILRGWDNEEPKV